MRYRFTANVNIEQAVHPAGSEFDEKDMPAGTLDSLKRRKFVELVPAPVAVQPKAEPVKEQPKKK